MSEDPGKARKMRPAVGRRRHSRRATALCPNRACRRSRGRVHRPTTAHPSSRRAGDRRAGDRRAVGRRAGDRRAGDRRAGDRRDGHRSAAPRRYRHRPTDPDLRVRAAPGLAGPGHSGKAARNHPAAGVGRARSAGRPGVDRHRGSRTRADRPWNHRADLSSADLSSADRSCRADRRSRNVRDRARVGARPPRSGRRSARASHLAWVVAG
jgi:hypothetical protein